MLRIKGDDFRNSDAKFLEDDDDIVGRINFDGLFDELPEGTNLFSIEPTVFDESSSAEAFTDPSRDSFSSWIDEIETMLMKDDDGEYGSVEPNKKFCDNFLADIIVDKSPREGSSEADEDSPCVSDDGSGHLDKEKTNEDNHGDGQVDTDNPLSKKRRRQLRNRDAAVRSRERKKLYVRDLEIKSRYLEGECLRLGRLLQCCYAENQALRLGLQSGSAFGASITKQESAVLLLESLLLGSLLWFLGIMCLFTLPTMPQSILKRVPLEKVGKKNPGVALGGAKSKMFGFLMVQSFVKSRRCKASRMKMKPNYLVL
ncbi:hypothetical protein I3760_08G080300 [Carya illinoinensis]|nr:hypothetical protein I3760_08G080300 [Carya illinoinensis]